jgi:uncharacterized membrane protein
VNEAAPRPQEDASVRESRLALALLTLAGVGFSLVLFAQIVTLGEQRRNDFLLGNGLWQSGRARLLVTLGVGALVPALAAAILLLRRPHLRPAVTRLARVLSPLLLIGLTPALFNLSLSHINQLHYLLLMSLVVLAGEPLGRASLASMAEWRWAGARRLWQRLPRPSSRVFFVTIVLLAAAGYSVYVGYFTILNHRRLATTAFDLGIYDNLLYNAMHGQLFRSPVLFGPAGGNYLAGHAEFAMLLFVPLYALKPGPETMLILQAAVLGFAAVPLYLFATTQLSRPMAAAVALAYLLYAPLHGPNFYDFHWLPLAIFFHFWLYFALATHRTSLAVVMVAVLFAFREDVAVGLALLGLFLTVTGVRPRFGMVLTVASVVWFALVRFVIMPAAGAWYFQAFFNELYADGQDTFGSVIKTIITNPVFFLSTIEREAKLTYALHMLAPLAFLPLRRPVMLLLVLPGFFFTIMTTGYAPTLSIAFQYTTHWIPYLFLAVVIALVILRRQDGGNPVAPRAAVAVMVLALLSHSYTFGAILQRSNFVGGFRRVEFTMSDVEKERYGQLKELLAMIPRTASVAATENECAHVSTRKVVYPLRWPPGPVDYLLVGRSHVDGLALESLRPTLADDSYGLLAERGKELFLFKRGHRAAETDAAKVLLGLPTATP